MKRWAELTIFLTLFLLSATLLFVSTQSTGIAIGESPQLDAAHSLGLYFDRIGVGESSFFDSSARNATWSPVHIHVTSTTLLSAFVWHVATSGYGWWGELASLRLGHALIAALSLPLLYSFLAPGLGRRASLLSVAFLAFIPRAAHQATLADSSTAAVTGWLLVLLCYSRARHASQSHFHSRGLLWNIAAGVALGVGVACSTSVLPVVVVLMLHTLWAERMNLRSLNRQGLVPMPATLLPMMVVAPISFLLATPWFWNDSAKRLPLFLVRSFSASPDASSYGTWYGPLSLILSVPAVTLLAAALGIVLLMGPGHLRFRANELRQRDRDLPSLLLLAAFISLGWPIIAPASLHASPPNWFLVLPFLAALAGLGLDLTLREVASKLRDKRPELRLLIPLTAVLVLVVPMVQTLHQPLTRSSAFAPLSGGPKWVSRSSTTLKLHDGSPAVGFIGAIEELGRSEVSIFSPEVPMEIWAGMVRHGVMRTRVRAASSPSQASLLVLGPRSEPWLRKATEGGRASHRLATIERDGAVLLELYEVH